jgi:hypothetical protein
MGRPANFDLVLTHSPLERAKASDQVKHLVNSDVPYARPRALPAQAISDSSWYAPLRLVQGTNEAVITSQLDWWEGLEAYLYVWTACPALVDLEGDETLTVKVEVCNLMEHEILSHTWTCTNADLVASEPTGDIETMDVLLSSGSHMKLALSGNADMIPSMGLDPGDAMFVRCTLTANNMNTGNEEIHILIPSFIIVPSWPSR